MKKVHSLEKGQIVVLLALALIALLAFTALAIDGGMIYADQRYSQSAADAASLAGGGAAASEVQRAGVTMEEWNCSVLGSSISAAVLAAEIKADANGYIIVEDNELGTAGHDHGVKVKCDATGYIDVEVMLSRITQTSFVHLINGEEMRTTVYSKTRVIPKKEISEGALIISLSKECGNKKGGVWFSGNNETHLIGGGIYSNSCVDRNNASSIVDIVDGSITYHEGSYAAGISDPVPVVDSQYHSLTDKSIPDPVASCAELPDYGEKTFSASDGDQTLDPGNYTNWDFKVPVHLNPGLYCIVGNVKMEGGSIEGSGITIRYEPAGPSDSLTINGGADTTLSAATEPDVVENYAVEDLLLYIPPGFDVLVTINGNSDNTFMGTLFMPDALVIINGTAAAGETTTMKTTVIGYWISVTGNSDFRAEYDPETIYHWPASISMQD